MNQAEVENENLTMLLKVADRLARALCDGAKVGRSKKELLTAMTEQLRFVRARCPTCAAEWPVMLLGPEDARHICVVARRASFLNLRRRLEEHFRKARLKCPSCAARARIAWRTRIRTSVTKTLERAIAWQNARPARPRKGRALASPG